MTVREALAWGTTRLRGHDCDGSARDAGREAEWLLRHVTGATSAHLLAAANEPLSAARGQRFRALVAARTRHTPLAWLLGTAWFMDREFRVTPDTLIPRPATESVVAAALAAARADGATAAVDVGTGSGCIAVTLAFELPDARIVATDASVPAIAAARRNARAMGVGDRILFRKANLLGLAPTPGHAAPRPVPLRADDRVLLVANLPYIPTGDRTKLSRCVRREPASALCSGRDGLDASRALLAQAGRLRQPQLTVAFEILPRQFAPLAAAVRRTFPGAAAPTRIKNPAGVTVGLLCRLR